METLVLALDILGTFVFALSGAMAGVRHRLDVFGVLVLSFVAGTAGETPYRPFVGRSPAHRASVSQANLRELVHRAREHSPVDDALQRAVPVTVEIETGARA